jgi:hypothetical protein
MTWLLQQQWNAKLLIGLVILIIGLGYSARVLFFDVRNAGQRVREIEQEIKQLVGKKLLIWESERGGLNPDYWRRVFFLDVLSRVMSR